MAVFIEEGFTVYIRRLKFLTTKLQKIVHPIIVFMHCTFENLICFLSPSIIYIKIINIKWEKNEMKNKKWNETELIFLGPLIINDGINKQLDKK